MNCPSCGKEGLLVETLDADRKRVQCKSCGLNEIRDREGRKLLQEVPSPAPNGLVD
jgi:transcription elongation factor Elf1